MPKICKKSTKSTKCRFSKNTEQISTETSCSKKIFGNEKLKILPSIFKKKFQDKIQFLRLLKSIHHFLKGKENPQ
jgi:hypothetical protein